MAHDHRKAKTPVGDFYEWESCRRQGVFVRACVGQSGQATELGGMGESTDQETRRIAVSGTRTVQFRSRELNLAASPLLRTTVARERLLSSRWRFRPVLCLDIRRNSDEMSDGLGWVRKQAADSRAVGCRVSIIGSSEEDRVDRPWDGAPAD